MENRKENKIIQIRINEELFNKFEKALEKNGAAKSKVLRVLIEKYVNETEGK